MNKQITSDDSNNKNYTRDFNMYFDRKVNQHSKNHFEKKYVNPIIQ